MSRDAPSDSVGLALENKPRPNMAELARHRAPRYTGQYQRSKIRFDVVPTSRDPAMHRNSKSALGLFEMPNGQEGQHIRIEEAPHLYRGLEERAEQDSSRIAYVLRCE